jgi:hypothetical protein
MVFDEKSSVDLIEVPLNVMSHFCLAAFKTHFWLLRVYEVPKHKTSSSAALCGVC